MFEYVPTAPLSFITAIDSRAARRRVRSRSTWLAHSATFAPNVVGSACTPCVRPIITVSRCVLAIATSVRDQVGRCLDQQIDGVGHRPAQRRVDDVGRREPVVDPRSGRLTDRRLHDVDERGHVVIGHRLAFEHRVDERGVDRRRRVATAGGVVGRNDAERGVALGREQLDLEPTGEPRLVRPHRVHLRCGVARDHEAQTR